MDALHICGSRKCYFELDIFLSDVALCPHTIHNVFVVSFAACFDAVGLMFAGYSPLPFSLEVS